MNIRNLKWISAVIILSLLSTACEEDNENPQTSEPEVPSCKITNIVETYSANDVSTNTFTYDAQGNVLSLVDLDEYQGENELEEYKFTYSNGKLITVKYYEEGQLSDEVITVQYSGDNISKLLFTYGSGEVYDVRFNYSGGQLVKLEEYTNYDYETEELVDFYLSGSYEITYQNGNMTRAVAKEFEGEETHTSTATYTYDDKINPLKGNVAWLIWEGDFARFVSNSNVLSVSEDYDNEDFDNYSFSYAYNEDGYPTTVTQNYAGETPIISQISYSCE